MASNENNDWIAETVSDFIHSKIWGAPINAFIEANCATFDYDDDTTDEDEAQRSPAIEEQNNIFRKFQRLADSLVEGLGLDLGLDLTELKRICQPPTANNSSATIDEPFEQLYAARDFQLFQEMMRRKNLILQLQALVSLQLKWGLLKPSDTGDDLVLALLLQATSGSPRHGPDATPSTHVQQQLPARIDAPNPAIANPADDDDDDNDVVTRSESLPSHKKSEAVKPEKKPKYTLPDLRRQPGPTPNVKWHRDLHRNDDNDDPKSDDSSNETSTPQTIGAIPEEVLREKLRELTDRTEASLDEETTAAMEARQKFLQDQRKKIIDKQRAQHIEDLKQQAPTARPKSARVAHTALSAATQVDGNEPSQETVKVSDEELEKRRKLADKLRRHVIDKR